MISAAITQTILLLSSGAFNVLLNPGTLAVSNQLFVSSVILMIGFAQGLVLVLLKVIVRFLTGWKISFSSSYLFAPLASAMSNSVNDRPGETEVNTPVVTPIQPRVVPGTPGRSSAYDGYDTEDEDADVTAIHFMPELEIAIDERRNVYTDIYLLGIATFTTTYCIDTISPVPTTAFVSGLLLMSITQSVNILILLSRSKASYQDMDVKRAMRGKRLLTITSCVFATGAFCMFCIGLAGANRPDESIKTMFDVTFSVILPLIAPWLLVTVSPKQQPMRTLFECTPFVFTICFSFVLFFLATRGQISAMVHEFSTAVAQGSNATGSTIFNEIVEIQFHSDVNTAIHFNMDTFSTTSINSAGSIPMLMFAPLVKIPTIVVVLANVINRSNLVVITALMVTMSLREITQSDVSSSVHRAYCAALALSIISLIFNVFKYMKTPKWLMYNHRGRESSRHEESVDVDDVSLGEL